VKQVLETVTAQTSGFWLHFDVDVIDSSEMPAVDCPEPDGPSLADISFLLQRLMTDSRCVGMEVTIYDPDRDATGECADKVARCLREALGAA
jgi:arginase